MNELVFFNIFDAVNIIKLNYNYQSFQIKIYTCLNKVMHKKILFKIMQWYCN